ncbi:MAG TPA: helix-hairpin-helix domain-containing protein [Tenuifilum sp.]|uniref:ComEA family DNA-binding protein n=1 Tax=Tenuifilum sp. TaxID=2760880 RepID=UPI002C7902A1|nr:helix-hairpin-helix domain-containing protein [Tenuifilum sp.]
MKRIWGSVKSFLYFSRGERNGTIILVLLVLLLAVAPYLYKKYFNVVSPPDPMLVQKADSFFLTLQYHEPEKVIEPPSGIEAEMELPRTKKSFLFDPNTVSLDSLMELGLSRKQAEVLVKYRSKGGRFRTPDDIDKIFVIDSATKARLKPLVRIAPVTDTINHDRVIDTKSILVELNSADTLSLLKLKGIGSNYAKRIVGYRNLLGGFYSIDQLGEVYGFTPQLVDQLRPNIYIDTTRIRKININLIKYDDLRIHPYVNDYQAKAIIYYRSQKGTIKTLDELWKNKLLPRDRFEKLKHYLDL